MLWAGLPYYDLELDVPVDYVEDYTLEERLGTAGRQQLVQNKKIPQEYKILSGNNGEEKELKHNSINKWTMDTSASSADMFKLIGAEVTVMLLSCVRWPAPTDVECLAEVQSWPKRAQSGAAL